MSTLPYVEGTLPSNPRLIDNRDIKDVVMMMMHLFSFQVFDVQLNGQHTVVNHLDIYAVAGLGVAHDEIVPFSIKKGMLIVGKEASDFDGILSIEFVKVRYSTSVIHCLFFCCQSILSP